MILVSCSIQLLRADDISGQGLDTKVTIGMQDESLGDLFRKLKEKTGLSFVYPNDEVDEYSNISLSEEKRSVKEVLDLVLKGKPLAYSFKENTVFVFVDNGVENAGEIKDNTMASIAVNPKSLFYTVTGTVIDVIKQEPMAGVNIIVKGTATGTTTDIEGKYSISANDNDILVFTFIGFKTYETQVNGRVVIDVLLEEDIKSLQEVEVNAGYWQINKKENTGNISNVSSQEISKQPITNPLQSLTGRIPGMYIQETSGIPGAGINVRIRGRNSINSGNNPLFIVDGVPFMSESLSSQFTSGLILQSGISPLNSISPSDIESIEVLKDADATAIYGSRGANGVILITTKKGKAGKTSVDINVYTGVSKVTRKLDMLSTPEYLEMRHEAFANDGVVAQPWDYDLIAWDTTRYTDWQEELIGGTAQMTNMQASLSGGDANTQFLLSGAFQDQNTVFPGDFNYKRGSAHFSINHKSSNQRLNATFSVSYVADENNLANGDLTYQSLYLPPNAPALYDEDGNLNWENSTWINPLREMERRYKSNSNNLISNVVLSYEFIDGLFVKTNLGFNEFEMQDRSVRPTSYYDPAQNRTPSSTRAEFNNSEIKSWIVEPQIGWNKKLGKGHLSTLIGASFQETIGEQLVQRGIGFSSDALAENINAAATVDVLEYNNSRYRYTAALGRINYNWDGKYILNITGRRDGSSRFGPGKSFGNFGAVGLAWIFTNEGFIKGNSILSFGKLRASYGTSGNDQIGDYRYLNSYEPTGSYNGIIGLNPIRMFNPDYAWEVNRKLEFGLELGFVQDRILFTASYYRNRSSNQLVNYPLAMTSGFTSIQKNLEATVQNTGLEMELNAIVINKGSIRWSTSINITVPRNKLVAFPRLEASSYANDYVIGKPLSIRKVFDFIGVDSQTGIFQYNDTNEDEIISYSDDRQTLITVSQDYYGGVSNSITYRGWQLDILLQFVKQDALNFYYSYVALPGIMANQPKEILKRWQKPGDEANIQRFTQDWGSAAVEPYFNYSYSDAAITDASFVRVKNVSLSYKLPDKWMNGAHLRLYLQGQNLFTITDYFGLDPETTNVQLPPLKTFTAGVQFTF